MIAPISSPRLDSAEAIEGHILALIRIDPRLGAVWDVAGVVEPRITEPGFPGIAKVVCGQQLSVASAAAIWRRFALLPGALDPLTYLR